MRADEGGSVRLILRDGPDSVCVWTWEPVYLSFFFLKCFDRLYTAHQEVDMGI